MLSKYKNFGRIIAGTVCAFIVMTSMVACGDKTEKASGTTAQTSSVVADEETAPEPPKEVTLTVSDAPTETDEGGKAYWKNAMDTLKQKYPYITIKPDEYSHHVDTFFPKAASGQLPDLYVAPFTEISKIIDAGYSGDITDAVKKYRFDTEANKDIMNLFARDSKYFGIPAGGYSMAMMYNVKLWKDAGLVDEKGVPKFPKTYEELAQSAQIIKQKTGKAGFFLPTRNNQGGWQFMNFAWAYGAEFEKFEDGKWKAVFNSPEAVAALQFVKDLRWKYDALQTNLLTDIVEGWKLLGTDQCAASFGSYDWINIPINDYKASKDNIALSSVPAGPAKKVSLLGGRAYFFSNKATPEQIDAGFKWCEVLGITPNSTEEDAKNIENGELAKASKNNIAGLTGLRIFTGADRVKMEDEVLAKVRNVNFDLFSDSYNYGTLRPEEPVLCQELYKTLDTVIQTVLTKKDSDPKALLDKAVATFQKDYLDKVTQ